MSVGAMFTGFVLVVVLVGLALAVHGFFGRVRRAQRFTVVLLVALPLVGLCVTIWSWAEAGLLFGLLGPAVTPVDVARAYNRALVPFGVSLCGALLVGLVAAIGWALARPPTEDGDPPRAAS